MASDRAGRRTQWIALLLAILGLLGGSETGGGVAGGSGAGGSGAGAGDRPEGESGPPYRLRVLADGELADLEPVLREAAAATGVTVELSPTTTREAARLVATGEAGRDHEAVWTASGTYLRADPAAAARLATSTRTMATPVVLGLRRSVVDRLGWRGRAIGWAEIAAAAGRHGFTFGMADPSASHAGVSALVGVATALSGTGTALREQGVRDAAAPLRGLFGAQSLKAHSSTALIDAYVRAQGAPAAADGLVDYESVLLSLNASGRLREPLELIYPSDGVATADYPLTLLDDAGPEARDAYRRLADHLRRPAVQAEIAQRTKRRPVVPGVAVPGSDGPVPAERLFELPFPTGRGVVDKLVAEYYGQLRRPARTVYVLDVSGSMAGPRLDALRAALTRLATEGPPAAARFQEREQATLVPFRGRPAAPRTFELPATDPATTLQDIRGYAAGLRAGGDTALYEALVVAHRIVGKQAARDPDRITTVVLLTDGRTTAGRDLAAFTAYWRGLDGPAGNVPVFPVLFGESDEPEMRALAELTGGQVFDARTTPLEEIFVRIRADQ